MTRKLQVRLRDWVEPSLLFRVVHLRPRAPRGSPKNYQRARAMVVSLHKWKVARMDPGNLKRHEARCALCRMRVRWNWPS